MDKIKSLLSPGHKSDENTMYETTDNTGKVAGEGSHFGDTKSGNVGSDAASTTAIKEGVSGSSTDASSANPAAIKAAQAATGTSTSESAGLPIYSEMTGKQDPSASLASSAAATAYDADKSNRGPEHESVATIPAATTTTQPSAAHSNIGTAVTTGAAPTSSIASPETSSAAHTSSVDTTPSAATQSSALPAVSGKTASEPEHHFNKDATLGAAVVGGGATGMGAYEASKYHESSAGDSTTASNTTSSGTSGPLGSLRDLINQKTSAGSSETAATSGTSAAHSSSTGATTGAATGSALGASTGALGASSTGAHTGSTSATNDSSSAENTLRPLIDEKTNTSQTQGTSSTESHTTRDAALGAAAGATGASAIGSHVGSSSATNDSSSSGAALRPLIDEKTNTTQSSQGTTSGAYTSQTTQPQGTTSSESHTARDATIGAATGAGLVGSYDYLRNSKDTPSATSTSQASTTGPTSISGPSHISSTSNTTSATQPTSFQSTAPIQPVANEESTSKDHHYGRDAALGAGAAGLGAAGLAEHEHSKAAEDTSFRDRIGSLTEDRGEGKVKPTADIPPTTTSGTGVETYKAAGLAEHEPARTTEDMSVRDRIGSLAEDRGEGKVKPTADIPPTTTSGAGIETYKAEHNAQTEPKERKGSILDVFKRNKDSDDSTAKAGAVGATAGAAAGLAEHEHRTDSQDLPVRERLGSLAADRGEGKVQPTADIPPTTTSGSGIAAYEADKEAHTEHKERKGSILDVFKRHKDSDASQDQHDQHHHGKEAAAGAAAVGAGAVGAHEYEKHHGTSTTAASTADAPLNVEDQKVYRDSFGRLRSDPTEKSAEPSAPIAGVVRNDLGQLTPADGTESAATTGTEHRGIESADSRLGEGTSSSHHHKEEAAAAGVAGGLGAAALAHEHDKNTTGTAGDLGESRGFFNEGYVHEKTEDDIKAEKRNSITGLGLLHREGRFHGKEGGAPGAVGVPPSERDQAYVESQKHLPTLHGNYGAHADEKARKMSGADGLFHSDTGSAGPNKLHKDPPADHPAAAASAAGVGASSGATSSTAQPNLLYGHHSELLKDTPDTNVENPGHDPVNMGYDGKTHLNLG